MERIQIILMITIALFRRLMIDSFCYVIQRNEQQTQWRTQKFAEGRAKPAEGKVNQLFFTQKSNILQPDKLLLLNENQT